MVSSAPASWTMVARTRPRGLLAALFVLVPVIVTGVLVTVPFSTPMGGFWSDAQQFAATGHIQSVFTPCGYPALLGIGFRVAGVPGVVAVQLLVYALIILTLYRILRLLAVDWFAAAAGAALLALHPDMVISIKKIWDTDLTVLFFMLLCATLLTILKNGPTPARTGAIAVLWGLSMTVRPNFPTLILPVAFVFWFARLPAQRMRTLLRNGLLALAGAAITVATVNTVVHGSFFLSQNGPYNFYAGDNALTEQALVTNLNAEPSIYPSLLAHGFGRDVDVYRSDLRPWYVRQARLYVQQNPLSAAKLVLIKGITLVRPDTKIYPLASLAGAVKGIEALALPLWLLMLAATRRLPWEHQDWLFVMCVVAYVAPFLLTNSDPRFRIPLDILVLTHSVYRVARFRGALAEPIA